MNKMVKGSIAGAAGVALLMGSFGTYALWTDEADLNGGTIQSGTLELGKPEAPVWNDVSSGSSKAIDISKFLVVPGDKLEMTQDIELTALGDNIAGVVSFEPRAAASHWNDELTYDIELSDSEGDFTFTRRTGDTERSSDDRWEFTGSGQETVTVTVKGAFQNDPAGNSPDYKSASIDLAGAQIVVTQTR